jgi:hypothetical protein
MMSGKGRRSETAKTSEGKDELARKALSDHEEEERRKVSFWRCFERENKYRGFMTNMFCVF